jgi:hypothetical protein
MRRTTLVMTLICAGCATYVTPGGPARLQDMEATPQAWQRSEQRTPRLPASFALVRVQAPQYRSGSARGQGTGPFSVVPSPELASGNRVQALAEWPQVQGAAPLNLLLLPPRLESLGDLRAAAARQQADVLVVYTLDTAFVVRGRARGPQSVLMASIVPDDDAQITSTATAVLTDVHNGAIYGEVEATARISGLQHAWGASGSVDRQRLEAEQAAFASLLSQAEQVWADIVDQPR